MVDFEQRRIEQINGVLLQKPTNGPDTFLVAFCAEDQTVGQVSVALLSFLRHLANGHPAIDIIVIGNELSLQNQQILQDLVQDSSNTVLRCFNGKAVWNNRWMPIQRRFDELSLLKIYLPAMVKRYRAMVFIDESVLVQSDITCLSEICENACMTCIRGTVGLRCFNLQRCFQRIPLNRYTDTVKDESVQDIKAAHDLIFAGETQIIELPPESFRAVQLYAPYPWENAGAVHSGAFWECAKDSPYVEVLRFQRIQAERKAKRI